MGQQHLRPNVLRCLCRLHELRRQHGLRMERCDEQLPTCVHSDNVSHMWSKQHVPMGRWIMPAVVLDCFHNSLGMPGRNPALPGEPRVRILHHCLRQPDLIDALRRLFTSVSVESNDLDVLYPLQVCRSELLDDARMPDERIDRVMPAELRKHPVTDSVPSQHGVHLVWFDMQGSMQHALGDCVPRGLNVHVHKCYRRLRMPNVVWSEVLCRWSVLCGSAVHVGLQRIAVPPCMRHVCDSQLSWPVD